MVQNTRSLEISGDELEAITSPPPLLAGECIYDLFDEDYKLVERSFNIQRWHTWLFPLPVGPIKLAHVSGFYDQNPNGLRNDNIIISQLAFLDQFGFVNAHR